MAPLEHREHRPLEPVIGEDAAIREAVRAAAVGIWQLDDTHRRFACDSVCTNILGLPAGPADLTVDALTELIPHTERPAFLLRLKEALLTGRYDHSHRIRRPDGSIRWVRSVGSRVRDSAGEGLLAGILMDITFLKNAEAAVARREESLQLLEQATDIGIYETGADESCAGSPSFFRQLGMAPQSGFTFPDFLNCVHPEDRDALISATRTALIDSDQFRNDFRIVRADTGEVRWISTLSQIFRDAYGIPARSIGAHIDITHQKRIEEDLHASREELATVFRQTIVGVLHRDMSHRVLIANERYCQIVGRSAEELNGLSITAFTHPDDIEASLALFRTNASVGKSFSTEKRYIRPDGSTVWCEVHVSFVHGAGGEVQSTITVVTDISERKRADEERESTAQWLRLALEGAAAGTLEIDLTNRRIRLNAISSAMYGLNSTTAVELDLAGWEQLLHPDDRAKMRTIDFREAGAIELRVPGSAGEMRWVRILGRFDEAMPDQRRIVGLQFDVTGSKRAEEALRTSEERLRMVQDAASIGSFETDAEGRITCSATFLEICGIADPGIVVDYDLLLTCIHPDDRQRVNASFERSRYDGALIEEIYRIVRKDDGEVRWVLNRFKIHRGSGGEFQRLVGALLDITERKRAELELIETKALSQSIVDASADCIALLDLQGHIVFMNQSGLEGIEAPSFAPLAGKPWASFWPGATQHDVGATLAAARAGATGRFTARNPTMTGRPKWWDVLVSPVLDSDGIPRQLLTIARDVTEQRSALERIEWTATHDALTQLPNRHHFQERSTTLLQPGPSSGAALILLDLDRLKEVNDTLGHAAGDLLLKTFAERVRGQIRAGQIVARLGGDEFAILLPGVSTEVEIERFVTTLRGALSKPLVHEGREIELRASMGVALFPQDGDGPSDLLKSADLALYGAKASNRGGMLRFRPEMRGGLSQRAEMVALAQAALNCDQVFPYYQPQISLADGRVQGVEALLRWRDPTGNLRAPGDIAAAFEDAEFAQQLGERMQDRVIYDAQRWNAQGLRFGYIAINAAATEFRYDDFAEKLLGKLQRSGVETRQIQIEITEGVFMGVHVDKVVRALTQLSRNGVTIALDDFGTGFSSLSHLKDFPVDVIKIDRSFVQHLDKPKNLAIVDAILNLGSSLGLAVVAEGIETSEQAASLRGHGCTVGQGYLFAHPMTASDFEALLRSECERP
jgi:diguanylate cyclase (GGDEF)-like protein/PAS domain S-box-containing protein